MPEIAALRRRDAQFAKGAQRGLRRLVERVTWLGSPYL